VLDVREAVLDGGGLDAITDVAVDTHPLAQVLCNASPTTTLGAKFSLPHAVAAALVTATGGADAFASSTLTNAAIASLRPRVVIAGYESLPPPPNDRPALVRVRMASGQILEAECLSARGGRDRPFTAEVFTDKLRSLTASVYPRFVATFDSLMRLDEARMVQSWPAVVGELCAEH
jgi:2-methylcitrate dehydratase PrpD